MHFLCGAGGLLMRNLFFTNWFVKGLQPKIYCPNMLHTTCFHLVNCNLLNKHTSVIAKRIELLFFFSLYNWAFNGEELDYNAISFNAFWLGNLFLNCKIIMPFCDKWPRKWGNFYGTQNLISFIFCRWITK